MSFSPLDRNSFSAAVPRLTDNHFRCISCTVGPPHFWLQPSTFKRLIRVFQTVPGNIVSLTTQRTTREHETHLCKYNSAFTLSPSSVRLLPRIPPLLYHRMTTMLPFFCQFLFPVIFISLLLFLYYYYFFYTVHYFCLRLIKSTNSGIK